MLSPGLALVPLLLVTQTGAAHAQGADAKRVFVNTGFEDGLEGWIQRGPAEFAVDDHVSHSGTRSARITVAAGAELHYQQIALPFGPVAAGDEFVATFWVRSSGAEGGTGAYGAMELLDAAGQRCGIAHSRFGLKIGANDWEQLSITGTAPAGVATASINLVLNSHGTAWFDDVRVERTATREPWPDLGTAERQVTIDGTGAILERFRGVGFHVFHHIFPYTQEQLDTVVLKRWRELNPSFARLNDQNDWGPEMLGQVAFHLLELKKTGTEVYFATWGPKDVPAGPERAAYAHSVVDRLEYFVRTKGADNVRFFCLTNELSMGRWGELADDLPKFRDYHQELYNELKRRNLPIGLLATDASPVEFWNTIEWATKNMDDITAVYGGHHYFNNNPPSDERFYPWFLGRLQWVAGLAHEKGKDFILGEFGCKQDGRTIDGKLMDACVYWDTPDEPLVGIQLADAVIASINAGVYAMGYWTFMDIPDSYSPNYRNKWGVFRWTGGPDSDSRTRDPYYAYGLLTKFLRGPATSRKVECADPYLRIAAVQHQDSGAWSIAVVNRSPSDAPLAVAISGGPGSATFRKYVYDPKHVPQNAFGDLQDAVGRVTMANGRMTDTVGAGTLTVYTTMCDDDPPAPVRGVRAGRTDEGLTRVTWERSPEPDLCYYRVFRGADAAFRPSRETQIGSTVATEFVDRTAPAGESHYKVLAVDQSGNASGWE